MSLESTLAAFATPLIGAVTVYIAWQQHRIDGRREARESRESRLTVYRKIKLFLSNVDNLGEVSAGGSMESFSEAVAEADFLFRDSATRWLSDVFKHALTAVDCDDKILMLKVRYHMVGATDARLRDADRVGFDEIDSKRRASIEALREAHGQLKDIFRPELHP